MPVFCCWVFFSSAKGFSIDCDCHDEVLCIVQWSLLRLPVKFAVVNIGVACPFFIVSERS
jgi:hypothetical protein